MEYVSNLLPYVIAVVGIYVLGLSTWLYYLAITNLIKHRKQLSGFAKFNGYILVLVGLILDVSVNWIIGTIVFVEIPREFLFTERLQRHKKRPVSSWRHKLANWLCNNLLNPFDPGHCD